MTTAHSPQSSEVPTADAPLRDAMLEAFGEAGLDAVLVVDATGKVAFHNRRFVELWGPAGAEVVRLPPGRRVRAFAEHVVDPVRFTARVDEAWARPTLVALDTVRFKNGRVFERHTAPLRDAEGRSLGRLWAYRDVTSRTLLEERVRQTDRLSTVGALAARVAHEINNPMSFVLANLQFVREQLEAGAPLDADATAAIDEAIEGAERVRHIVRDLRLFARTDVRPLARVGVDALFRAAATLAAPHLRGLATLTTEPAPGLELTADEGRLLQALVHLLLNAAQSRPDRTRNVSIRLRAYRQESGIAIEVVDDGRGMAPEVLARAREPFFTTRGAGAGAGLGLPLCAGIVEEMGGDLVLTSAVEAGTVARILLPAAAPRAAIPPSPGSPP